jgi:ElonginA binding-protein 1
LFFAHHFPGEFLHKLLSSFVLSKAELKEHGFPLPHETEHGRAVLHVKDDRRKKMPKEWQRECSRCGIVYTVDNKGMPAKLPLDELCIFHPKRTFKKRRGAFIVNYLFMSYMNVLSREVGQRLLR